MAESAGEVCFHNQLKIGSWQSFNIPKGGGGNEGLVL